MVDLSNVADARLDIDNSLPRFTILANNHYVFIVSN